MAARVRRARAREGRARAPVWVDDSRRPSGCCNASSPLPYSSSVPSRAAPAGHRVVAPDKRLSHPTRPAMSALDIGEYFDRLLQLRGALDWSLVYDGASEGWHLLGCVPVVCSTGGPGDRHCMLGVWNPFEIDLTGSGLSFVSLFELRRWRGSWFRRSRADLAELVRIRWCPLGDQCWPDVRRTSRAKRSTFDGDPQGRPQTKSRQFHQCSLRGTTVVRVRHESPVPLEHWLPVMRPEFRNHAARGDAVPLQLRLLELLAPGDALLELAGFSQASCRRCCTVAGLRFSFPLCLCRAIYAWTLGAYSKEPRWRGGAG